MTQPCFLANSLGFPVNCSGEIRSVYTTSLAMEFFTQQLAAVAVRTQQPVWEQQLLPV